MTGSLSGILFPTVLESTLNPKPCTHPRLFSTHGPLKVLSVALLEDKGLLVSVGVDRLALPAVLGLGVLGFGI